MNDEGRFDGLLAVSGLIGDLSNLQSIHSGSRHRLYRYDAGGTPLILKIGAAEPTGESVVSSVRHEFELLRHIKLPGIVRVLGLVDTGSGLALAMEDVGDGNLAQRIQSGPLSVTAFLDIAVQLAEAVARLHAARIIHRDIHPGNVVWNSERGVATLCDFAIARTLPTLVMDSPNPNQLEGTLPYMSPEQTGRTGRSVDWRADLYSLGATFYETLTGAPPFAGRDAAALAHAQIARLARPVDEINAHVPPTLSRIVLKLLEKEPEHRYQSATALAEDLREARTQWLRAATIEPFSLASHEVPRALSIPDRLYGRDEELQSLTNAFARTRSGGRELVLVTGAPGIGKSALVDRIRQAVSDGHGYYAAGKFDQLQRSVPFSGLAQALRSLVRQLLTEPEASLDGWRQRIEEAVTPNGRLLVAIVPELERLLGPQPPVLDAGPVESINRFRLVVTRFLRVFARPEHPLVLFLDDLQWIDAASLQLLEQWVSDTASHHLLVIGAYRDNEVGPSHPLALSLSELRDAGCDIHTIHLKPLGSDAIAQLAADTFGEPAARMQFLADLVIRKSAGNPFFVRRLLHLMHAQGLFRFASDTHRWTWDESQIERAPISDNVLDLMVLAIDRLPHTAKQLLETGACIGHQFELGTLAELTDRPLTDVTDQLWPAIEDGLLVRIHDAGAARDAEPVDGGTGRRDAAVRFAHDRVQQAAYGRLSEPSRQALHHAIGRRLLDRAGDALDEQLFEIVDQLDLGQAHVVDETERRSLVELNLAAGQKAKASAAYRAAFEYLTVARRHLAAGAWEEHPELTFAVHRELAESAYLAGEHATAEQLVEITLEHAQSKTAQADLYGLRVLAATVASDWPRALHWGRVGLSVFGLEWPLEGLAGAIEAEAAAIMANLGGRKIEDFIHEPDVEDEDIRASMRLLGLLGAPAYFSGSDVLVFLMARAVNLTLMHGPSPCSAFGFVLYGGIHNALTGQYDVGYAFGKLALALARRFGNRAEECRTLEVYGVLVHHWKAPLREGLPLLQEGFRAGTESGETAFAAFSLNAFLINALPSGMPLTDLLEEAAVAVDFATTQKNKTSVEMALVHRQIARALTGATSRPDCFDDEEFTEAHFLEHAGGHETALGHFWVAKLQTACLMGDYAKALECSREAEKRILKGILGMITSADHVFYTALATAGAATLSESDLPSSLDQLRTLHGKLVNWAGHCPQNFAHKVALVGAEMARLDRKLGDALMLYRTAIDTAERERFVQDEALAHELRARCLLGEHEPALAAVHIRLARDRYREWGATAKVAALEREFPECFRSGSLAPRRGLSLDEMALIKASQAISSETTPERLFEQIVRVVVEVTGAQKGALVLPVNGALQVRARIETAEEVSISLAEMPLEQCVDLPSAILRYVMRTKEFLLLSDAGTASLFANDPVVQQRKLQSVLCIPLIKQSTVLGLIYLENNAMAGAFSDELVEIGQVLAAQAVISLENSTLLEELQQLTGALEARVAERTQQLTDEIAARDRAETALRESEERQAFLLRLSDALRPLGDAVEIKAIACRVLGEALRVNRAFYAEVQGNDWMVTRHYEQGAAPLHDGAYSADTYGRWIMDTYRGGERIVFRDTRRDPRFAPAEREAHAAAGIISAVGIPLVKNGTLAAILAVHCSAPREWTDQEIGLIDETAERTWAAVERARVEAVVRESEERLREADRRKDEFIAMLAHELRNPLAPIRTGLELIRVAGNTPAAVERVRSTMDRQVSHMVRLIDDLLDVSRISSGKIQLHREPTPLSTLVNNAIEANRTAMSAKRIELTVDLPLSPCVLDVDPTRFVQVLSNLLHNATKFTGPGGAVHVSGRVSESHAGAPSQLALSVSDSGIGISREFLPRVFDLFSQGDGATSQAGLGIGLALARRLVEMQGGAIEVRSEGPGCGSEFVIRLPLCAQSPRARAAETSVPGRIDCRVMVIDDNRDAANVTAMLVEELGGDCRTAYDGETGVREALTYRPHVVLLDIGMPGLDGFETCRRIRRELGNDVTVVAVTGFGQQQDKERTTQYGFDAHLTKPADPAALKTLLGQYGSNARKSTSGHT